MALVIARETICAILQGQQDNRHKLYAALLAHQPPRPLRPWNECTDSRSLVALNEVVVSLHAAYFALVPQTGATVILNE